MDNNKPVFVSQRHNVGDGSKRGKVGILVKSSLGVAHKRADKLENHPHAGKRLKWVRAIGAAGVYNGVSRRGVSRQLWWSVIITSTPSAAAKATSSTAVIPVSTVIIRVAAMAIFSMEDLLSP